MWRKYCLQEDRRDITRGNLANQTFVPSAKNKVRNLEGNHGSERTSHLETDEHSPKMPFGPWFPWEA